MISLQALLASNVYKSLPTYILIGVIAILVLAFIIGAAKGFRKVGKVAFGWALAGVAFIVLFSLFGKKSPFNFAIGKNKLDVSTILWAFALLVICIVVTLLLHGIVVTIFCPTRKKKSKNKRVEVEFDDDDDDFEEEGGRMRSGTLVQEKRRMGIVPRLFGGLVCMIGVASVLVSIVAVFLLIVNGTKLAKGDMGAILQAGWVKGSMKYVSNYALDFITIGIIFWIAYRGYKTGVLGLTGKVIGRVGTLLVVVAGFALPFLQFGEKIGVLNILVERCWTLYAGMKSKLVAEILGRVTAGAIVAIIGAIIVLILSALLNRASDGVKEAKPVAFLDQALACLIYLVLGIAICLLFWGVLYILDACNIFNVSTIFSSKASLSKECFVLADNLLGDFVEKYLLRFVAK